MEWEEEREGRFRHYGPENMSVEQWTLQTQGSRDCRLEMNMISNKGRLSQVKIGTEKDA